MSSSEHEVLKMASVLNEQKTTEASKKKPVTYPMATTGVFNFMRLKEGCDPANVFECYEQDTHTLEDSLKTGSLSLQQISQLALVLLIIIIYLNSFLNHFKIYILIPFLQKCAVFLLKKVME